MKEVSLACQTCGSHIGVTTDFREFLDQLSYYGITGNVECLKCANMRVKIEKRNIVLSRRGEEPVGYPT